jgi:hypothetical protein
MSQAVAADSAVDHVPERAPAPAAHHQQVIWPVGDPDEHRSRRTPDDGLMNHHPVRLAAKGLVKGGAQPVASVLLPHPQQPRAWAARIRYLPADRFQASTGSNSAPVARAWATPARSAARLLTEPLTPAITRRVPTTTAGPSCCLLVLCTSYPTRGGWSGARGRGMRLVQALLGQCPGRRRDHPGHRGRSHRRCDPPGPADRPGLHCRAGSGSRDCLRGHPLPPPPIRPATSPHLPGSHLHPRMWSCRVIGRW